MGCRHDPQVGAGQAYPVGDNLFAFVRTVLLSIQALLAAPEPDDPQDAVVARQYQDSINIFRATAMHWAAAYAGADHVVNISFTWGSLFINLILQNPEFDGMLRQLKDMGVEEGAARVALSSCAWNMQKATDQLFS